MKILLLLSSLIIPICVNAAIDRKEMVICSNDGKETHVAVSDDLTVTVDAIANGLW